MYQELINKQKQFFKTKITYDYNFRKEMLKSLYHMIKPEFATWKCKKITYVKFSFS